MATSLAPVLLQLFDNNGDKLAGGLIYTYEAGTTTPLATYQDLEGLVANANPVVLNSAGRGSIRLTDGVYYKFVIKDSDGVTLDTIDDIVAGEIEEEDDNKYLVHVTFAGTAGSSAWLGGAEITHTVSFPINFDGSAASVGTNPASSYAIDVKKNGVTCGTITFNTSGVASFATASGAPVNCIFSDRLDFYGPASAGTAANILITLVADL